MTTSPITLESLLLSALQPTLDRVDEAAAPEIRRLLTKAREQLTTGQTEAGLATMRDLWALRVIIIKVKLALLNSAPQEANRLEKERARLEAVATPGAYTMAEQLDMAWGEIRAMKPAVPPEILAISEAMAGFIRATEIQRQRIAAMNRGIPSYHGELIVRIDHGSDKARVR